MRYKNRQIGVAVIIIIVFTITLLHLAVGSYNITRIWPAYLFLGFVTVLFSSLTISIEKGKLTWFFGPRFWKKSITIEDIKSAEAVRNEWFYGLGIRMLPSGWLYNVSGLDAVKIKIKNGETIYLGTNEPQELLKAIQNHVNEKSTNN